MTCLQSEHSILFSIMKTKEIYVQTTNWWQQCRGRPLYSMLAERQTARLSKGTRSPAIIFDKPAPPPPPFPSLPREQLEATFPIKSWVRAVAATIPRADLAEHFEKKISAGLGNGYGREARGVSVSARRSMALLSSLRGQKACQNAPPAAPPRRRALVVLNVAARRAVTVPSRRSAQRPGACGGSCNVNQLSGRDWSWRREIQPGPARPGLRRHSIFQTFRPDQHDPSADLGGAEGGRGIGRCRRKEMGGVERGGAERGGTRDVVW